MKGIFDIKTYDDEIISSDAGLNLIMDDARPSMASAIAGIEPLRIDRIVLGTGTGTFDSTRTKLFSEESGIAYQIDFTHSNATTNATGKKLLDGSIDNSYSDIGYPQVLVSVEGAMVTFMLVIPTTCGNIDGSSVTFSEAALYANGKIFSMKTFNPQTKTNSNQIALSWAIVF